MAARRTFYDQAGAWRCTVLEDDPDTVRTMITRLEQDVAAGHRLPPGQVVLQKLVDSARRDGGAPTRNMMARLMVLANQCGLSRDDRLELAEVILRRDVGSWASFTNDEAKTLGAAMEGFAYICHIQAREGRRWREERAAKSAAAEGTAP